MTEVTDAPAFPRSRTCPYHPSPDYDELRDGAPLHRVRLYSGRTVWVVTRYDVARRMLADQRLSINRKDPGFPVTLPQFEAFRRFPRRVLSGMDAPEHGRYRRMLIGEFTGKRIKAMRPEIEQVIRGFLDGMIAAGPPADLVSSFSSPVPSMIICRMLGVPYEDHDFFQDASRRLINVQSPDEAVAARAELEGYIAGLADSRGYRPGLIQRLVDGPLAEGEIDHEDLVELSLQLLLGGHESTASMTSLGVVTLLEHPGQLAVLRTEPEAMVTAVEELLRFLSIADISGARVAKADIEVEGLTIRAGEGVLVDISINNRDGATFTDPDTLDVRRPARNHLAFGYGIHQCIGQHLARAELQIALTALFDRLPGLRLAVPAEKLRLRPTGTIHGLYELPVTW
ncbi:MAG TPA: cytochrome P450 [Streptosporangiaceae bacterium]